MNSQSPNLLNVLFYSGGDCVDIKKKHQNNGSDDPRKTQADSNNFKIRYIEVHKLLIVLQIILN